MLPLEHSAILSSFIKQPFVIKIFVLSIFEWQFFTGFTVQFLLSIEKEFSCIEFRGEIERGTCIKGLKTESFFLPISSYWFIRRIVQV